MRLVACVIGALLLAGCGRSQPAAGPASESSTTASAARGGTSPTPSEIAFSIPPSLNCRLPYATKTGNGFISFPSGVWTVDPSGATHKEGAYDVTDAALTLRGTSAFWSGTASFDSVVNRWLPVRREQVSPDGHAYSYLEEADTSQGRFFHLHRVSLPDGIDRVIFSGATDAVLGWNSDGIILTTTPGEGLGHPLTVVDPATGASRQLSGTRGFELLDGTVAWADDGYIMPSHIYREDLAAGTVETWLDFSSQGSLNLIGLDVSGHPIVTAEHWTGVPQASPLGPAQTYVLSAPTTALPVGVVPSGDIGLTDSHGTWLATPDGLYFLDDYDHLFKVSDLGGNVAGSCT